MSELSVRDVTIYLQKVRDLESSLYTQKRYIDYIRCQYNASKSPKLYDMLEIKNPDDEPLDYLGCFATAVVGILLGMIIGGIPLLIFIFSNNDIGSGVSLFIGFIIGEIIAFRWLSKSNKEEKNNYNKTLKENDVRQKKNEQIIVNSKKQEVLLTTEYNRAMSAYSDTEAVLNDLYSANIIYSKYRGLVPITMFCEYFESGICSSLTGHEGAYNTYETQARLDVIMVKLDEIITRLDRIIDNQYMLANLLKNCQQDINRLSNLAQKQLSCLQDIKSNQEISAYYNRITARNTEYMKWLTFFRNTH